MSAAPRLAGFAAVLAATFAAAALAGGALGRVHDEPAKPAGMHDMEAAAPQAVRGLAVADGSLALRLDRRTAPRGRTATLRFRIVDRRGATVRAFDTEHTKRMHLIVVRRDLTGFQHLHPTQAPDGSWSTPVTLREAGTYRVLADFSAGGRAHTLADDLAVDGAVRSRPLPAPARAARVDGFEVRLTRTTPELAFAVTRSGRPVALQDYLGAKGHLVALREGDLAFLHVHPDERRLRFMATFPSAGRYRLFLQFRANGRVHTAAFTQEVSR